MSGKLEGTRWRWTMAVRLVLLPMLTSHGPVHTFPGPSAHAVDGSWSGLLRVEVRIALKSDDVAQSVHLLVDPTVVVAKNAGIVQQLANVTKEAKNPLVVMDRPWEVDLGYVSVVWADELGRFVMYYSSPMCCDSFTGLAADCPGCVNRSCLVCDDPRALSNVTGTKNNPRTVAALRAESVDGLHWSKPSMWQVSYNGTRDNNALQLNQSVPGVTDGNWGVFRDEHDRNTSRRYKMVGNFYRTERMHSAQQKSALEALSASPPTLSGYVAEPRLIPSQLWMKPIASIKHCGDHDHCISVGANRCTALGSACASFSVYEHAPGWVQLWNFNDTTHPDPNSAWDSWRKASVPPPLQPSPLVNYPGFHFGTVSSADGRQWHSYTEISSKLQARGDTANNAVYDPDTKTYLIFTRLDCSLEPFSNNPSLLANCSKPWGLRREARSSSKAWGVGANWTVAKTCAHGKTGDELYNLTPFRDSNWRRGLWFGLASFMRSDGSVHSELMISSDNTASWSRVAAGDDFIKHGARDDFDSTSIYAAAPVHDPVNRERMLLYYRGTDVPDIKSVGHTSYGLAYCPRVPAGFGGTGSFCTRVMDVVSDTLLVDGDADAFQNLRILAQSQTIPHATAKAVHVSRVDTSEHVQMKRFTIREWQLLNRTNAHDKTKSIRAQSSTLSELVGSKVSFTIHLNGGVLFSIGFG